MSFPRKQRPTWWKAYSFFELQRVLHLSQSVHGEFAFLLKVVLRVNTSLNRDAERRFQRTSTAACCESRSRSFS